MGNRLLLLIVLLFFMPLGSVASRGFFKLPVLPEPAQYGNLMLDQGATENNMQPVSFSHWLHRENFTCSVCHEEIGFSLEANETGVTEADNRAGRYCGACHNGWQAFSVSKTENCGKCHNGDLGFSRDKFTRFSAEFFPTTPFGNRIDWVSALRMGLIKPKPSPQQEQAPSSFKKQLTLIAEWNYVPPAIFPHDSHLEWMSCGLCHPDTFMIKKKSTEHFRMREILKGKFCGVCHLSVAFPLDDCQRCHPEID